jgi:hypothetical protein
MWTPHSSFVAASIGDLSRSPWRAFTICRSFSPTIHYLSHLSPLFIELKTLEVFTICRIIHREHSLFVALFIESIHYLSQKLFIICRGLHGEYSLFVASPFTICRIYPRFIHHLSLHHSPFVAISFVICRRIIHLLSRVPRHYIYIES